VLTDLVTKMLDISARRARAQGVANIGTTVCSADDLPFGDPGESQWTAIAMQAIAAGLARPARSLRVAVPVPGGEQSRTQLVPAARCRGSAPLSAVMAPESSVRPSLVLISQRRFQGFRLAGYLAWPAAGAGGRASFSWCGGVTGASAGGMVPRNPGE
jgi:hypothetical protein